MEIDVAQIRKDWTGFEFDSVQFAPLVPEALTSFAEACGEVAPRFVDPAHPDFQAVPNFTTKYHGRRMWPEDFPKLSKNHIGFDGGKAVEVKGPIRAGDAITAKSLIHDIYEKTGRSGGMMFVVHRMRFFNQHNELVSVVDWRLIQKPDA